MNDALILGHFQHIYGTSMQSRLFSIKNIVVLNNFLFHLSYNYSVLTGCAETGAGGEFGHVDDFNGELLAGLPVDASPHYREGSPEKRK